MWKFGDFLDDRLIKSYGSKSVDPFGDQCSVHNCALT